MASEKNIRLIAPSFGRLPEWFKLFLLTCGANPEFEWLIITDDPTTFKVPPNVIMRRDDFHDFKERVARVLAFDPEDFTWWPYKLSDLKPFLACTFRDDIVGYNYWGFSDIDLLYGSLSGLVDSKILDRHDIVSFHSDRISWCCCIISNTENINSSCMKIYKWHEHVACVKHIGIDEGDYSAVHFFGHRKFGWRKWQKYKNIYRTLGLHKLFDQHLYAKEMFTTPLTRIM